MRKKQEQDATLKGGATYPKKKQQKKIQKKEGPEVSPAPVEGEFQLQA